LPAVADPRVLVDAASHDDAAVFRLSEDRALVASTDFFTPIVDDAATWGAIAAANALSDLYAMGATPLFALNLVAWPRDTLPFEILGEVISGAAAIATAAECPVLGGHSIDDAEPKFGMAVIGEAHPDRILTNAGAKPGDVIVLTKPLGTGIITTALKESAIQETATADAVRSMTTLNAGAARVALAAQLRAATDVTGFGLIGHLHHILQTSAVGATIEFAALPIFEGALELAGRGFIPGGTKRNLEAAHGVNWDPSLTEPERMVCVDAQTSGGLLLIVPNDKVSDVVTSLRLESTPAAATIGRITAGPPGAIIVARGV
ncbi:MAG: selenide, water dikinase SelD, partial [Gemmatimonadales bacterium]|nr:selenide, water dikinase SelD [Gemmatimonadales bacterium]